jgi:hypothetical protein
VPTFNIEELQESVSKVLIASYDFTIEDAEEAVTDSVADNPDMWNENADAESLAKYLASDGDDE